MVTINLVVLGGSRAFGTAFPDCDYDYYGVFTHSPKEFGGLYPPKESYQTCQGEMDYTFHELRKFCRLAVAGNPTILDTLFSPYVIYQDLVGRGLRGMCSSFLSKRILLAYLGYATNQLERYQRGVRLHSRQGTPNPKFVSHAARLLYGGLHLAKTGEFLVMLPDEGKELVLRLREGSPDRAIEQLILMRNCLAWVKDHSGLPDDADVETVETFLHWARYRNC